MKHQRVKIADLRIDGCIRGLVGEPDHTDGLEQDIAKRGVRVPIVIAPDFYIVDGYRRVEALLELALK